MKHALQLAGTALVAMTLAGCAGDGLMSMDLNAYPSEGFYGYGPGEGIGYGYPGYFGSPILEPGFEDGWGGGGYWGGDDDDDD